MAPARDNQGAEEVALNMQQLMDPKDTPRPPNRPSWDTEEVKVSQNHRITLERVSSTSDAEDQRIALLLQEIHAPVTITVVDYCATKVQFHTGLHNNNLREFLAVPRPDWVKVRWINCERTSGDVLIALSDAFDLHALAVEDASSFQRIKADFYDEHVFVATYVWDLQSRSGCPDPSVTGPMEEDSSDDDADDSPLEETQHMRFGGSGRPHIPSAKSAAALQRGGIPLGYHGRDGPMPRPGDIPGGNSGRRRKQLRRNATLTQRGQRLRMELRAPFLDARSRHFRSLKRKEVMLEQVSIFLCPNGVLLSFFQDTGSLVVEPIHERLRGMQNLLTESEDASILLHALLEATIDYSIPVFQAFARKVSACEDRVLSGGAKMAMTYKLHVLYTDLIILLRSFAPLQHLITTLSRSDARNPTVCISPLTKLHLEDLNDQAVTGEQDLQSLMEAAHHLLELNLNSISHRNESANSALAVISALFLPCTFLTGIYGMNWTVFPELEWHYGYAYFWGVIACVICLSLFMMWYTGLVSFCLLDVANRRLRALLGRRRRRRQRAQGRRTYS